MDPEATSPRADTSKPDTNASKPNAARARLDAATTEKQLEATVVELARWRGWLVFHPWTSVRSAAGWPDIVALRAERIVIAELKSERGKTTQAQEAWLEAWRAAGAEVHLWRPSDLRDIEEVLA
jgi:hypothetical protein